MAAVYATDISSASADDNSAGAGKNGGIFRSSTARAVLAIASTTLLIISLVRLGANRAASLKELSDTVMNLTKELNQVELENEHNSHEVDTLEKKLLDAKIDLVWKEQHVESMGMSQELMYDTMVKQIHRDQDVIEETTRFTSEFARTGALAADELQKKNHENSNLKQALAFALEELANAREGHPRVLPVDKDLDTKVKERKLRGVNPYMPGDNIEIIEDEEGGKVALRPGE